ncbi:MAG: hypothetical protein Q8O14_07920 [bacterium]|jgi:hypothetical protein|nr:hypothetical protein [bacterium]
MSRFNHVPIMICLLVSACGVRVDHEAAQTLRMEAGSPGITVLPVMVRNLDEVAPDTALTSRLAEGLEAGALVHLHPEAVALSPGWDRGHAGMWSRSVREFRTWRRHHPVATNHALLVECLMGTRVVGAVHVLVVDRAGRLACGLLLGQDDPLYQDMAPQSAEECVQLALTALRRELVPARAPEAPSP